MRAAYICYDRWVGLRIQEIFRNLRKLKAIQAASISPKQEYQF